ncbi:MAG: hypothetical protein AB8D52_05420 [Gammaproteobacteria bacterium]
MNIKYSNIHDFELIWRWTHDSHRILPEGDLSKIKALNSPSAEILFIEKPNLSRKVENVACTDTPTNFLKKNLTKEIIYVFWNPQTAVETDTETLIKYFNDFCYPSSDDICI